MVNKSYSDKLKDPRWQKLRLEVFERDGWMCQNCGDKEITLHVHHKYYEEGKEPWEYEIESLITVCEDCHKEEYNERKNFEYRLLETLKRAGFFIDNINQLTNDVEIAIKSGLNNEEINDYFFGLRYKKVYKPVVKLFAKYYYNSFLFEEYELKLIKKKKRKNA